MSFGSSVVVMVDCDGLPFRRLVGREFPVKVPFAALGSSWLIFPLGVLESWKSKSEITFATASHSSRVIVGKVRLLK